MTFSSSWLRPRLLLLVLYVLLQLHVASAQTKNAIADLITPAPAPIPDDAAADQQVVATESVLQGHHDRPGAAEYEEARGLLQSIKPPRRRLARYDRPSGLFGTAVHYAKGLFYLLFMNGPRFDNKAGSHLSPALIKAVGLMQSAADQDHEDAVFELAEMNFYGLHTFGRNYTAAFTHYQHLADLEGNSTAQHMLGFMYATGIGGVVQQDQAKALLYHTFAADAEFGDVRALMTTAYRHHSGIGTPRDCEKAVHYYQLVADIAMDYIQSGPPGGQSMPKEAYRLADEHGGIYGEGASVSSSGENAKRAGPTHDANAAFDDVLEYLDLMSRKGELKAIFSLGRLHYDGSRVLQRNYRVAADRFFEVARRHWDKNGKTRPDTDLGVDKLASKAAGYLGRMFLRGEGLEQNFQIARVWFKRGIENGDALSQYSMGLLHLHGLGVPADPVKAASFLGAAADQDLAVAQVRFATLLMDQGDLASATKYLDLAARSGHIEAFYYLAEIAQLGANGQPRDCNRAALYYKLVAEKAEPVHSSFDEANDAYEDGDVDTALLYYMMAAEQGYEVGQANVAYLLDRYVMQTSQIARFLVKWLPVIDVRLPFLLSSPSIKIPSTSLGEAALALIYWTRSAKEQNVDSLLKMGDYYLAELDIPPSSTKPVSSYTRGDVGSEREAPSTDNSTNENHAKAAACYLAASETYQSAQALFNLGWMHENGIGLAQDFHLAKRYYDQAAEPPMKEAKAPVALALLKLRGRSWWNWVTGGSINGIRGSTDKEKERASRRGFWEWLGEFLAADLEALESDRRAPNNGADDDAVGYMDEWGRTLNGGYGEEGEEEDWEHALGDLVETLAIVAFAGLLALLVWWRMIAVRHGAREQHERQARLQAQDASPLQSVQQQSAEERTSSDRSVSGTGTSLSSLPATTREDDAEVQDDDDVRHLFEPGLPNGAWAPGAGGMGH